MTLSRDSAGLSFIQFNVFTCVLYLFYLDIDILLQYITMKRNKSVTNPTYQLYIFHIITLFMSFTALFPDFRIRILIKVISRRSSPDLGSSFPTAVHPPSSRHFHFHFLYHSSASLPHFPASFSSHPRSLFPSALSLPSYLYSFQIKFVIFLQK